MWTRECPQSETCRQTTRGRCTDSDATNVSSARAPGSERSFKMTWVSNATGKLRKVLLCPPTYFSFQPINEITKAVLEEGEHADLKTFLREHEDLIRAYRDNDVEVELMEPVEGLPYMVYREISALVSPKAS